MKIRSLAFALSLLLTAASPSFAAGPAPVAGRPVLWSVQFDAERLRAQVGPELLNNLGLMLNSFAGEGASASGGPLTSIALYGLQPQKGDESDFPFLAQFGFSPEGGGSGPRFEAIARKRNLAIEDLAGAPSIHFQHEGKTVWIVKVSDTRVLVGASRELLTLVLQAGGGGLASSLKPGQLLGGNVEVAPLIAGDARLQKSELLKLLPHLISNSTPKETN